MNTMISALMHHQSSFAACETQLQTLQTTAESVQDDIKLKSNQHNIDNRDGNVNQLDVAVVDQEDQLHSILQQSHQIVAEQKKALGEAASVLQQIWSELNQTESSPTGKQAHVQPLQIVEYQAQHAHNVQVYKLRASNVKLHLGQLESNVQLREMKAAKLTADSAQVRQLEADLARKDKDLKEQKSKIVAMKMANSSALRKIELQHMDLMNANQREKLEVLAKTARDLAIGSARLALTRIQIQRLQQEGLERDAELSDAEELNASLEFELAETMANLVLVPPSTIWRMRAIHDFVT